MIEIKNVCKEYKAKSGVITKALNNINLSLPSKGMIFILGKSGSGKSTLLNIIGCMDKVTCGEVLINNKNISSLSERKLNDYRNSCFGFIFQDHNLIENYTVYDNLRLPCTLKKLKYKNDDFDKYLHLVSLDGLGKRHVNELSGGQKTRVSIARALIRNNDVILADEPTGSLDVENSLQVFNTLKNISLNKLVVVVTHDTEYAYKYGDRVISLEDGNVIKDEILNDIVDVQKESLIAKSRLSFLSAIKFSSLNLKGKTIRLIIVSLIVSITLTLAGYSYLMSNIDVMNAHVNALIDNDETTLTLTKKVPGENLTSINPRLSIGDDEVKYIKENISNNIEETFRLVSDNEFIKLEDTSTYENDSKHERNTNSYYDFVKDYITFTKKDENYYNNLKLIGNKPSGNNDAVIHKVLADYLLNDGIVIIDKDSKGKSINRVWYPKDYNEIVSSNYKVLIKSFNSFNTNYYVTISGILDEDMSKYEILKNKNTNEVKHENKSLYNEFSSIYKDILNDMFVSDKFYTENGIEKNKILDYSLYDLTFNYNDKNYYGSYTSLMSDSEISMYNGKKIVKINDVKEDEIVLDSFTISILNGAKDNFFGEKYKEYSDKIDKEYEKKELEREEKVNEEIRKSEEDPNYKQKVIPEVVRPSSQKIYDDFIKNYFDNYGIIGKTIEVTINDSADENVKETHKFKVIGYVTNSNYPCSLVNNKVIEKFLRKNKEIYKINIDEKDKTKIMTLLTKYSDNENYHIETVYTSTINTLKKSVLKISDIFKKASYGCIVFSIVILTLYILISIKDKKKDIGILRSLGTKISGVYKIFYTEGLIIGFISVLTSTFMIFFGIDIINNYVSKDLFYNIKPIMFDYNVIIYISVIVFLVVSVASIIPLIKISKSKVIDLIYDK